MFPNIRHPTDEIVSRTYCIRDPLTQVGESGTGFFISKDKKAYLVTAAHVMKNSLDRNHTVGAKHDIYFLESTDGINTSEIVQEFRLVSYGGSFDPISAKDYAVFQSIKNDFDFENIYYEYKGKIIYYDDVFFLGFPGEYKNYVINRDNSILPFAKKGIISSGKSNLFYIDAVSNPGFSGGPMLSRNVENNDKGFIIGIVNGKYASNTVEPGIMIGTGMSEILNSIP